MDISMLLILLVIAALFYFIFRMNRKTTTSNKQPVKPYVGRMADAPGRNYLLVSGIFIIIIGGATLFIFDELANILGVVGPEVEAAFDFDRIHAIFRIIVGLLGIGFRKNLRLAGTLRVLGGLGIIVVIGIAVFAMILTFEFWVFVVRIRGFGQLAVALLVLGVNLIFPITFFVGAGKNLDAYEDAVNTARQADDNGQTDSHGESSAEWDDIEYPSNNRIDSDMADTIIMQEPGEKVLHVVGVLSVISGCLNILLVATGYSFGGIIVIFGLFQIISGSLAIANRANLYKAQMLFAIGIAYILLAFIRAISIADFFIIAFMLNVIPGFLLPVLYTIGARKNLRAHEGTSNPTKRDANDVQTKLITLSTQAYDRAEDVITKGIAIAGVGSKETLEKAKIKTLINNLENERKQFAVTLGMEIYKRFTESGQTPDNEKMANFIAEINNRLDGIAYQQAELKRIEAEAAKVTGKNTGFSASTDGQGKLCSCGYENEITAKFCAVCGSPL